MEVFYTFCACIISTNRVLMFSMFKNALLIALGVLAGFFGALTVNSFAQREAFSKAIQPTQQFAVELAAGQCRYGASPDGMWWQSDQEHSNRYKTNGCMQFGASLSLNPAWEVSARYINLGNASLNSLAISCPGDDCSKSDPALDKQRAECEQKFTSDCRYRWKGAGGARGILFGTSYKAFEVGGVSAHPEVGLFAYRLRWSAQVYPLSCTDGADSASCQWRVDVNQKTGYYVSPEIGFMLRWRNFFAGTQYFLRTTQHTDITAGIGGPAQTWIIGARIPL